MIMPKLLTLAVIIPVYNEERHIKHCLEALTSQEHLPDEIIVVDNNSTDNTVSIAKDFKGVRVVREKKQGLIAARNKGFESAKSDILCRIDADAILDSDWLKIAHEAFVSDKFLNGVTGLAKTRAIPRLFVLRTTAYARGYFWAAGGYFNTQVLWGANMAIRSSAWHEVKNLVCLDDKLVHEDQDISLCLISRGGKLQLNTSLKITTEGQVYHYFPKLHEYLGRVVKTRKYHRQAGRWPVNSSRRYSVIERATRIISSLVPGLFFYAVSFLYWPLDRIMIALHGDVRNWLEK